MRYFYIYVFVMIFSTYQAFADVQIDHIWKSEPAADWLVGMAIGKSNVYLTDYYSLEKYAISNDYSLYQTKNILYTNNNLLLEWWLSHLTITDSNIAAGTIQNQISPKQSTNRFFVWDKNFNEIAECIVTQTITSVVALDELITKIVFFSGNGNLILSERNGNTLSNLHKLSLFNNSDFWPVDFCDLLYEENILYAANTISNKINTLLVTNNTLVSYGQFGGNLNEPDGISFDKQNNIFFITYGGQNSHKAQISVRRKQGETLFNFSYPLDGIVDLHKVTSIGNGLIYCLDDWYVSLKRIRALLCPSNSISDSTSTGNTNSFIDPGEDFDLKIALENWCWTNISPSAWIDVEKTIATNSSPQNDVLTNWFSLPQTTGFFNNISHRGIGWQTNSFPFFMPTNPQASEIILCFEVSASPIPSNFNVCTTFKLNNPDAIYNPTSLFLKTSHSVVTNIPLVITNVGTRELVSICTNNFSENWWSINPITNIVAPGSSTFAYVSVDSSLLTTTDGVFNTFLFFDENEHLLYNPETSNFYDADGTIVPFKIIASGNQPPVWLAPNDFTRPEWTDTLHIYMDATDDWTSLLEYQILEGPTNATCAGWIIIDWIGHLVLAMRTGIWEYPFTVTATDKGIPPLTSTQKFVVTVTHLNFPCDIDVRFDYPNPYYIDEGSPWNGLVEITDMNDEDAPFLTMWASNLPPVMTFEPVSNHLNFYWLNFPAPVEGEEYSNIVFHGSDNYAPSPRFAEKSSPTIIVVPESGIVFSILFSVFGIFFSRGIFKPHKSHKNT